MGGTFMSLPADYRDYFVRNLHDALSGHTSRDVAEAVRCSEASRAKCIGMTIETRPDFCLAPHLAQMLSYGCTRLEIGLQVCRRRPQGRWEHLHGSHGSHPSANGRDTWRSGCRCLPQGRARARLAAACWPCPAHALRLEIGPQVPQGRWILPQGR